MLESLFNKVGVLSCEICKLFTNNYFEEHLWTSSSKLHLKRDWTKVLSCEFCELFKNTYFVEDLQTAGSETPVRGSFFNKVARLTAWRLLTVLERLPHRYFSVNLRNFQESFFSERLLAATSHMMLFSSLFADQWGLQPKIILFGGAMVY